MHTGTGSQTSPAECPSTCDCEADELGASSAHAAHRTTTVFWGIGSAQLLFLGTRLHQGLFRLRLVTELQAESSKMMYICDVGDFLLPFPPQGPGF